MSAALLRLALFSPIFSPEQVLRLASLASICEFSAEPNEALDHVDDLLQPFRVVMLLPAVMTFGALRDDDRSAFLQRIHVVSSLVALGKADRQWVMGTVRHGFPGAGAVSLGFSVVIRVMRSYQDKDGIIAMGPL